MGLKPDRAGFLPSVLDPAQDTARSESFMTATA